MGIRFLCPNGHKLNVKGFLAGKRGICPECDARFLVPMASGGQVEALREPAEALDSTETKSEVQGERKPVSEEHLASDDWHVRSSNGIEKGPILFAQLKALIAEGNIDKDSWVWRTGWLDWQRMIDVFPEIEATSDIPDAGQEQESEATPVQTNAIVSDVSEFVPEESVAVAAHRRLLRERRQRARKITLALSGLICLLAIVLAIILSR